MKNKRVKMLAAAISLSAAMITGSAAFAQEDATEITAEAESEETADGEEAEAQEEAPCIGEHYTIDVNGVSLYYEVAGEGKPIVLVHGNGGNHKVFSVEIQQFVDAGYQVYALDSRGQGENEPLDEYHYTDMAEDVYQFITELGLEKPAYYGWSDGGIIALELEIAHPNTLGLAAISGTNLNPEGADPEIIAIIEEANEADPNPLNELMLTEPNIDPEDLTKIEIPVLVLAGSEDVILQEHTELIADKLPNSELHIVEGEDHGSYIQGSDIAGNLVLDFLQEHDY
ncbi:MAG: alpha/beta hydrolase [Lachnospiraceae bacterium]|nr:alpha/beta hydrolase [Lachnospiraceae bacterium]